MAEVPHGPESGPAEAEAPKPTMAEESLNFAAPFTGAEEAPSEADQQKATERFKQLVQDYELKVAADVQTSEVDGQQTSFSSRDYLQPDGSIVRVNLTTREPHEKLPSEPKSLLRDEPVTLHIGSWDTRNLPTRRLIYTFGVDGKLRREEENDPTGEAQRILEISKKTDLDEISLERWVDEELENEGANEELEQQLNLNNQVVGPAEVEGLDSLLLG